MAQDLNRQVSPRLKKHEDVIDRMSRSTKPPDEGNERLPAQVEKMAVGYHHYGQENLT